MPTMLNHQNHNLHHKSLAVLEEIRLLLEVYGQSCNSGHLRLDINFNHGIPARLTQCQETRRDIPLKITRPLK